MGFKRALKKFSKNKGAVICLTIFVIIVVLSLLSDYIVPYDIEEQNLVNRLQGPSKEHIFGTDDFGRDIFSRVLAGGKTSVMIGFSSVLMSLIVGVPLGLFAGYYKVADMAIMRVVDVLMSIPEILLAMAIVAVLGTDITNVIIAIAVFSIPSISRIVRANVLSVKTQEYVEAAITYGQSNIKIIFGHILPNIMHSIIVVSTMRFATSVLASAGLSFLGLGVQPPTPDWGQMINLSRNFIRNAWWLLAFPGGMLVLFTVSINVVGDALRDTLDPKIV